MPTYSYICSVCDQKFELFAHIKDYVAVPKCIHCGAKKTQRSYVDDLGSGFVKKSDDELKTIGDLANRNRDKMSEDQKISLYEKHNSYKNETSNKELPSGMTRMKKPNFKIKWH